MTCFVSTLPDGRLAITRVNRALIGKARRPRGKALPWIQTEESLVAEALYAVSRIDDPDNPGRAIDCGVPFDPLVHTLAAIAAGIQGHCPLACRAMDDSELPAEQALRGEEPTFRDAWEDTGTAVQTNMPKARLIHMGRIRSERDAALSALDVPFMRAVEAGDAAAQQRIAAEKQALRDIPQTFDLDGYATPEALKAAWPKELS